MIKINQSLMSMSLMSIENTKRNNAWGISSRTTKKLFDFDLLYQSTKKKWCGLEYMAQVNIYYEQLLITNIRHCKFR